MSVLEMLDKLDQIEILYEPIYSADGHRVVAYEVIGQINGEKDIINIEQFTYQNEAPEDIRAEIEQLLVRKSLQFASEIIQEVGLYIPCNPNLLMIDFGESYFAMLKECIDEQHLPNITLVMAEHLYKGDITQLHHVVRYIKTYDYKFTSIHAYRRKEGNYLNLVDTKYIDDKFDKNEFLKWTEMENHDKCMEVLCNKLSDDCVAKILYGIILMNRSILLRLLKMVKLLKLI